MFLAGPGCSSVGIGAFSENGPFKTYGNALVKNNCSWNSGNNHYKLNHARLKLINIAATFLHNHVDNVDFYICLFSVSDFVEANMLYWETPAGVGFSYSTNSSKTEMNDVLTGFQFTLLLVLS